jgi:SAM-dependent methyltransferase
VEGLGRRLTNQLPVPPPELASRVGPGDRTDPLEAYEREGRDVSARIRVLLGPDWAFENRRVLDFGCGSARVLRHFHAEARTAEFWGCDIDGPSIDWLRSELSPPFHGFQSSEEPPLPFADGYLDLVWAASVFTHIERWAPWLAELHRVLAPGGLLVASYLGEGMWEALVREPYREDEVGMTVLHHWRGPDADVLHSEWWLRAHWGRAFEVVEVARPPRRPDGSSAVAHSWIALRKREVEVSEADLERCDPAEPRELAALRTNLRVLRYEMAALRDAGSLRTAASGALRDLAERARLRAPARRLRRSLRSRS